MCNFAQLVPENRTISPWPSGDQGVSIGLSSEWVSVELVNFAENRNPENPENRPENRSRRGGREGRADQR